MTETKRCVPGRWKTRSAVAPTAWGFILCACASHLSARTHAQPGADGRH